MRCRVCGGAVGTRHLAREMMFGSGQMFPYFECSACGCLQIEDIPPDLGSFYPRGYYAFATERAAATKRWLRSLRDRAVLSPLWPTGSSLPGLRAPAFASWMRHLGATRDARILDVGCGSGELLARMADAGFRSLLGVDPFIRESTIPGTSVRLMRATIDEVDGQFDLIMFHHSLEHILDQRAALAAARERLAPGGWCLVRVPTVSSWAWRHYREHWVQLDAPRHLMIQSTESMRMTAAAAGLQIDSIVFDSTELQYAGSELYRRGLPLAALAEAFPRSQMRVWRRQAESLNANRRGDQAAFYFRAAPAGFSDGGTADAGGG